MEITHFKPDYLPDVAALFAADFHALRATVPSLPDTFAAPDYVTSRLKGFFESHEGVVALDEGRVVGYLGWLVADDFRGTGRRGVYIPEWAHSATDDKARICAALLSHANAQWVESGCGVYAISLLAHDRPLQDFWFWNGYGLMVVDAIRSIEPINALLPDGITIRKATVDDVPALAQVEQEHAQHYRNPPVLMAAYDPHSADELVALITGEASNAFWIALDGDQLLGFMRFEAVSDGAAGIVDAPDKIAITGAFVRSQARGRGVAAALLDAALKAYAAQGFMRCSVDFESFNPNASGFWLKYFAPVRLSVARVPELQP